jgi:hypothetical protein
MHFCAGMLWLNALVANILGAMQMQHLDAAS